MKLDPPCRIQRHFEYGGGYIGCGSIGNGTGKNSISARPLRRWSHPAAFPAKGRHIAASSVSGCQRESSEARRGKIALKNLALALMPANIYVYYDIYLF